MKFIKYFHWVAKTKELSTMEKMVYCALLSYQGDKNECWPAQETLADALGISKPTVHRTIKSLVRAKWVSVRVFGHGKTNRYSCLKTESGHQPDSITMMPMNDQPDDSCIVSLMSNLHQPDVQPTSGRSSLVVDKDKTILPTNLPGVDGRKVGRFSLKEMIDKLCEYRWRSGDIGTIKYIEKTFTKEQIDSELEGVVDSWVACDGTKNDIKSIPKVLAHRLKKQYE